MPLVNCKINLQLIWPVNCVITNSMTLCSDGNSLDSRQYKTTKTNEFRIQKDIKLKQISNQFSVQTQNQILDYLVKPSVQ